MGNGLGGYRLVALSVYAPGVRQRIEDFLDLLRRFVGIRLAHALVALEGGRRGVHSAPGQLGGGESRHGGGAGDVGQGHAADGLVGPEGRAHGDAQGVAHALAVEPRQQRAAGGGAHPARQSRRHEAAVIAGGHQRPGAGQLHFDAQRQCVHHLPPAVAAGLGHRQHGGQHRRGGVHVAGNVGVVKIEHFEQGAVHHCRRRRFHPGPQPQDLRISFTAGGAGPVVKNADHFVTGGADRGLELVQQQAFGLVADVTGNAAGGMFPGERHQALGHREVHAPSPDAPSRATAPYIHSSRRGSV